MPSFAIYQQHDDLDDVKELHTLEWPFLIKGLLENPTCATTTPETLAALLWTTTAVFGIVYAFLGEKIGTPPTH